MGKLGDILGALTGLGADLTVYEDDGFKGRSIIITCSIPDLSKLVMSKDFFGNKETWNDRISSLKYNAGNGYWEVFQHANYKGKSMKLGPGMGAVQVASIRQYVGNDAISSIKYVPG